MLNAENLQVTVPVIQPLRRLRQSVGRGSDKLKFEYFSITGHSGKGRAASAVRFLLCNFNKLLLLSRRNETLSSIS